MTEQEPGQASVLVARAINGERLPVRVLICSGELPPMPTGCAMILDRQLRGVAAGDYLLVGFGRPESNAKIAREPPVVTRWLPTSWYPPNRESKYRLKAVRANRRFVLEIWRRAKRLLELVRTEHFGLLLVATNDSPNLPAAWLAAKIARIPLIVYLMDDWRHVVPILDPSLTVLAGLIERAVLPRSASVITHSPLLAEELATDFGIAPELIGIPLPQGIDIDQGPPDRPWPTEPGEVAIVFTGLIYGAHYDAIANVLQALELPGLEAVRLHVYTSVPPDSLEAGGLSGKLVVHEHVAPPGIHEIQRSADILLLPLGFSTPYPDVIRTAAPTKTGEYLASGRPILVHAPPTSLAATLARRDGFAAVADRPRPEDVATAIRRIIDDQRYRRGLVHAAWASAVRYHHPRATTSRFLATIERVYASRGPR